MNDLTHLSLFTGIGGIDLAAEWAGFSTIGQVEQATYANRIARLRFGRRIPRWSDIRDLTADDFKRRTGIDSPTLISGGFPCQPFSCAGKRRGKEDDRHLWPEMFRVVRELRPAWVLGENVAGLLSMGIENCLADLEGEGYTVRAFLIPACGVGALHRRERVFIVAHADNTRSGTPKNRDFRNGAADIEHRNHAQHWISGCGEDVADPDRSRTSPGGTDRRVGRIGEPLADAPHDDSPGFQGTRIAGTQGRTGGRTLTTSHRSDWWDVEPAVGRVAHGVPHRVDRLRCLGNAVVPQQVYPILAGIAQIEKEAVA